MFRPMKFAVLFCLLVAAQTASAQFIAQDVDRDTASGRIEITDASDGFSRILEVGGTQFFADGSYRFVSVVAQRGALYLIEASNGGNGCGAEYVWLHTEAGTARLGPMFGNCVSLDTVTSDAETVTVTIQSRDAANGFVDFIYDGRRVIEQVAGQRSAGIGLDAEAWVGRYPFEMFSDADWRAPLVTLMGEDAYRRAGNTIETASEMRRQGAWVVGRGCRSRQCDVAYGAVAIHEDGRVVIALRTDEADLEVFGALNGELPTVIMDVMQAP